MWGIMILRLIMHESTSMKLKLSKGSHVAVRGVLASLVFPAAE